MEFKDIATLIAAVLAFFIGLINVFLSIHRNSIEGVTKNRMEWITHVRDLTAQCLTAEKKTEFNLAVVKLQLYLNCANDLDKRIINQCKALQKVFKYKIEEEEIGEYDLAEDSEPQIEKEVNGLLKAMQIYLKMEWTRVKCENSILKFHYWYCWDPFRGFSENRAIKKITKEYNR